MAETRHIPASAKKKLQAVAGVGHAGDRLLHGHQAHAASGPMCTFRISPGRLWATFGWKRTLQNRSRASVFRIAGNLRNIVELHQCSEGPSCCRPMSRRSRPAPAWRRRGPSI